MFWQTRAKKFRNNPLHEAVLDDDRSAAEKNMSCKEYLLETNALGLTPLQLAHYLQRSALLPLLSPLPLSVPSVEKEGKVFHYTQEEFDEHLGIRYVHHLAFPDFSSLVRLLNQCQRALKENRITSEQQWLGRYYRKEFLSPTLPGVLMRWVDSELGWGVFATKEYKVRDYIGEYTGAFRKKDKKRDRQNSYCFDYLIGETETTPYLIDARDHGNFTRFINHDKKGNCDPRLIFSEGMMKVILYANQTISKGSQLTYDYGLDYWSKRERPSVFDQDAIQE